MPGRSRRIQASLMLAAASKWSLSMPALILWIAPMTPFSEQTIKRVVVGKGVTPGRQSFEGLALHCSQSGWGSQTKSRILDKFSKHLWKLWLQSTCDTIRGKIPTGAKSGKGEFNSCTKNKKSK